MEKTLDEIWLDNSEKLAEDLYKQLPLLGNRVVIRRYRKSDAQLFYEVASDPKVSKYMPCEPLRSKEQAKNFIESAIRGYRLKSHTKFAIARADNGRFMGTMAVYDHGIYGIEVGYWLHPKYWGMGCATEALSLIIPTLRNVAPTRVIYMDIAKQNNASIRLAHKFGFIATRELTRADIPIYRFELL